MNKILKRNLMGIGALGVTAVPLATTISCGKETVRRFNILPTYTGQADQMIALGIHSDYYPLQLNTKLPFEYLTSPGQFMTEQGEQFKTDFANTVKNLISDTKGPSWWNQDAKNSDDYRISNTYWQKQKGEILLYEHYLLDDDQKVIEKSWAPQHNTETSIQTNFRSSRDPYTRLPKGVFYGWDLSNKTIGMIADGTDLEPESITVQPYGDNLLGDLDIPGEALDASEFTIAADKKSVTIKLPNVKQNGSAVVDAASAKIIQKMRAMRFDFVSNNKKKADWFYNDWYFVDSYHRMFLDNSEFQNSSFTKWLIDSTKESPFTTAADRTLHKNVDDQIKQLFTASTYSENEVENGINPVANSPIAVSAHHPIYEQQDGEIGAAPMFEGGMRDNQLYLFNIAWQLQNLVTTGTTYGQQFINDLPDTTPADKVNVESALPKSKAEANTIKEWITKNIPTNQINEMKTALVKANKITLDLYDRMTKIKKYLSDLGLAGKTFGFVTIAPGHGVSTMQSMSKYSFLYKELGFTQPVPNNIAALAKGAKKFNDNWKVDTAGNKTNSYISNDALSTDDASINNAIGKNAAFNMDDNGWFWNLGETGNLSNTKIATFENTLDLGAISGRADNVNAEFTGNAGIKGSLTRMFKSNLFDEDTIASSIKNGGTLVNYDLWNEGIKTPFVMHMVLDQVITISENYAKKVLNKTDSDISKIASRTDAVNWGEYFTKDFLGK